MSTKVFSGIRFPKNKIGEFVDHCRPAYLTQAEEVANGRVGKLSTKSKAYKEKAREHRKNQKPWYKHTRDCRACLVSIAMKLFNEAADSSDRVPWADLNAGVNIWFPKGRYAVAASFGESLMDIEMPEWVEEYAFWDNVDPSPSISTREWNRRGKVWDSVLTPNSSERKLVLIGFDATRRHTIDLSWLAMRMRGNWPQGDPYGP